MLFRVGDHLGTPWKFLAEPFLAPGGNDFDLRRERRRGQLEAHLIVSLAGRTVGHRRGRFGSGDLDHALGDQWPGDARAQEILSLVQRSCLHHGKDKITGKFLSQIVHLTVGRSRGERLGFEAVEFLRLTHIGAEGDDLRAVGFLEPVEDDGGIQSTRIRDDDFHGTLKL